MTTIVNHYSRNETLDQSRMVTMRNPCTKKSQFSTKSLFRAKGKLNLKDFHSITQNSSAKSPKKPWSPYRIGFDEINEELDNQWEEDF